MSSKPTFRSSEVDRVLACNGSITLVPLVARRKGGEGYEGTLIHWHIASRAISELGALPPEGGLPPAEVPAGFNLPPFSAWMIPWAIEHIKKTVPADWSLLVEVPLAYEFERFNLSGHIDLLAISPDGKQAKGIDWKSVRIPVDPADSNEQVASYLALIKRAWPGIEIATFQIVQPLIDEAEGERISESPPVNLNAVVTRMEAAIGAAMDNAMEVNTGLKQCSWCPAGIQCQAMLAEREKMKMKLTKEQVALVRNVPDDAQLAEWVATMKLLARPAEDAEDLLHERLDQVPQMVAPNGTVITRKIQKGAYQVPNPQAFMEAFRNVLPPESIPNTWTPSMTNIKDEIARIQNLPRAGKAAVTAETVFEAHFRPLVNQGERKVLVIK